MAGAPYTAAKLRALFPENDVMTDACGLPSVTVRIPMFRMCDVVEGGSSAPHPAFVTEGRVLEWIGVSKFQNTLVEGHACSLPDVSPATGVDYDTAVRLCAEKGVGWHLMTAAEWGAIALWCRKNGHLPMGNNDWGRDYRESESCARKTHEDTAAGICHVATGSGPASWSHDGTVRGIWDLNANVWEWVGGLRLVCGELQLCERAEEWFALDGRSGEKIAPGGKGTTENSVKLDYVGGIWTYTAAEVTDSLTKARFCDFAEVRADDTLCPAAIERLVALGLMPSHPGEDLAGVSFYANNGASERMPFRGGRWGQGANAGVFKTCLDDPRSFSGYAVGFRAVYAPEEKEKNV